MSEPKTQTHTPVYRIGDNILQKAIGICTESALKAKVFLRINIEDIVYAEVGGDNEVFERAMLITRDGLRISCADGIVDITRL